MPAETSEQTIHRALASYGIGKKLRRLRLRKHIGLVDLGKHTGLSASMLSQLETGKLIPTLPTLVRIAMVFDVGLDHFFVAEAGRPLCHIVRAGERIRFPDRSGAPEPEFFFECLAYSASNKGIEAYSAEFPNRSKGAPVEHRHDGAELLYLIEGTLALCIAGEEQVLEAGDSAYFDGSTPHSYACRSEQPAKALVVTIPPRL